MIKTMKYCIALRYLCLLYILSFQSLLMAAELKVLSAGAVEPGVEIAIHQFEKSTGHHVQLQFGTGPQLKQLLAASQEFDILIAPNALIDEQANQGRVKAASIIYVGKVGAGIAVRKSMPMPNITTIEDLKSALLAVDRVIYNKASTGIYLEQLFIKIGVMPSIQSKVIRYDNGESVLMHLVNGSGNEIGFGAITEIKLIEPKGLQYVGSLPANVQNYTSYQAAVAPSSNPVMTDQFLQAISVSRSNGKFESVGIE